LPPGGGVDEVNPVMTPGKKLAGCVALLVAATGYLAYLGAASSWQYYLTVDECLARASTLSGSRLRVSGKVLASTLHKSEQGLPCEFALEGKTPLAVRCTTAPPENLAEQMEVVVEGQLDERGVLRGDKVLTRCASKYQSRDASAAPPGSASSRDAS
jgi:cytochrome c-type biogenesis protein CcmE